MRYRVKSNVQHGVTDKSTRSYSPGEIIELDQQDATPLLSCGAIEPEHLPFQIEFNHVFVKGEV